MHAETTTAVPAERGAATARASTLCGWTIERALGVGPVCASFLGARGAQRAVLRVLGSAIAADADARAEWLRASWAANRFHHSRVVKVLDQGVDSRGTPVIVRGFAQGQPLGEAIRDGRLDLTGILRLVEQLLDALEMAHAHGVLHGAITPTNVVVTPRGTARLLDFAATPGLFGRRSPASEALAASRLGPLLAPERRFSPPGPATELSDVWGVGVCLQYALGPLAGVSEDVSAVAALASATEPSRRYESAYAMLGDVRRLLAGKRPRLDASLGPVPSQHALPPSSSGTRGVDDAADAGARAPTAGAPERRGNVLLVLAIAVLVGAAAFVVVRERLTDAGREAAVRAAMPRAPAHAAP
jgi:serine/threonine-protein kinase